MSDPLFTDLAMKSARAALDGLAKRQEAISNNIANVDTPGYKAVDVQFETALSQQLTGGGKLAMKVSNAAHLRPAEDTTLMSTVQRPGGSTRADGNNVDIDVELAQMTDTGLRYESLIQLVSRKISLLRSIATGR